MTLVSQSSTFDTKAGKNINQYTYEDFQGYYNVPDDAFDVQKTQSEGKYVTTFKQYDRPGGAYNYQIQSSLSTEPLLTHPIFAAGGSKELSADDKKKIQAAQNDPTLYAQYVAAGDTTALGWYSQFILWGVESYLAPTVTLHITTDEDDLPDLTHIGKVASISNGPSLGNQANWLFSGCTAEALTNGKWRISKEYRASGPAGWSSTLYGTGS
jgi:hypothetical protein